MKLIFRFSFCLYLFFTGLKLFSQDIIILKNGDEIQSKVLEVSTDIIKYKKWNNQDGPIYSSNKIDIFMIKYQNGTKDVFNTVQSQTNLPTNDNSIKVIEIAKPFMEKQIFSESNGACKLVEFNKQNGVEKDIFGQKIYTLEYLLIIELQKDFWKASEDKWLGAEWYWTNFSALDKKGDIYAEKFSHNYAYFTKGTRIEITGIIDFENTDNGWRLIGVNMFSYGYKNKTSKILSIVNNDNSAKPELSKSTPPVDTTQERYVGDYKDGKKHGHGKMIYKKNSFYEGEWIEGKMSGQGKRVYPDGSSYEGEWKDDKMEGYGTVMWANGKKYVGYLLNNQRHGKGIMYDKDGNKTYEGDFKNGELEGYGILTFDNSKFENRYEGEFKNGDYNGQGTLSQKNKENGSISTFKGEFKSSDMYNGILTTINLNGNKETTEIKKGKRGKIQKEK